MAQSRNGERNNYQTQFLALNILELISFTQITSELGDKRGIVHWRWLGAQSAMPKRWRISSIKAVCIIVIDVVRWRISITERMAENVNGTPLAIRGQFPLIFPEVLDHLVDQMNHLIHQYEHGANINMRKD